MIKTIDTDDLVEAASLARELAVNRSTFHMWAARRETNGFPLPELTFGRTKVYSRKAVVLWMRSSSQRPTS